MDDQVSNAEEKNMIPPDDVSAEAAAPSAEPVVLPEVSAELSASPVEEPLTEGESTEAAVPIVAGPKHAWYVVHCYSGYENKVKKGLEQRLLTIPGMQELIFRAVVPTEEEIDLRDGQRKVVQRRVFPGYILVEMVSYSPDDPRSKEAWYVVRNTPGVTGFVSSGDIPTPLRDD